VSFDATRFVARAINRGDDEIMDQALETRGLPLRGPASWLADRFGFIATAIVTSWKRRFAPAVPLTGETIVYDVGTTEQIREHRRYFVRHHFGEELDFVGRWEERVPDGGRGPWLRWYALGVVASLCALTDFSPRRHRWLGGLLLDIQSVARAAPGIRRAYVFSLHDRRAYLIATFLAKHTGVEVLPVFQNIPMYRNCRYFHLDVAIILTSRVNVPEVEYYRALDIFKGGDVVYRGGEYIADTVDLESAPPTFDLGYFSSGEWARSGGLYQSGDIDAIRRGDLADTPYARTAQSLIEALAKHAHANGLTLRLYPHPVERRLWDEHGIEPPYAGLDDGSVVTIDRSGRDSRSKVYEPRVAVSLQSSFIWERLDLGLDASYIYAFADQSLNVFARESLGRYAENVFLDEAELIDKVSAAMAGSTSGT
jgi:hypothetical protein